MAFSLRAGTNWCHDFPKLARESGFYFNMHRRRVRVDWNRISSIDVDRVVAERDFLTIDENVNNVVDYCLESEYDVKILDPNFVKLFRLAQLAVEYLLYCKQYLDHSVVILKDELKLKTEENAKLQNELGTGEKIIKELRDKLKERSKLIETKLSDSHGEVHKCLQCPKTFVSALFLSAHVTRRHPNVSYASSNSPVHEQYRAETEKLHNEIKSLKERLNLTERVIRNESEKFLSSESVVSNDNREIRLGEKHDPRNHRDRDEIIEEQHRRYQEEIGHLKETLFDEIRNLKYGDRSSRGKCDSDDYNNVTIKELIRGQENEIRLLRQQISTKATEDTEKMETKRDEQAELWQSKIENLESRYRADIEKLYTQLRVTQESADRMRIDYITRISDLERREASVESTLIQTRNVNYERPSSPANREISRIKSSELNIKAGNSPKIHETLKNRSFFRDNERPKEIKRNYDDENWRECSSDESFQNDKEEKMSTTRRMREESMKKSSSMPITPRTIRREKKQEETTLARSNEDKRINSERLKVVQTDFTENFRNGEMKNHSSSNFNNAKEKSSGHETRERSAKKIQSMPDESSRRREKEKITKKHDGVRSLDREKFECTVESLKEQFPPSKKDRENEIRVSGRNMKNDELSESYSEEEDSESWLESESLENSSQTEEQEVERRDNFDDHRLENRLDSNDRPCNEEKICDYAKISREDGLEIFRGKLRDLGIDPEWRGIPDATFAQLLEVVRHHRNINSKKHRKFEEIRRKLIHQLSRRLSIKERESKIVDSNEPTHLERLVTNVKSKVSKALNILDKNEGSHNARPTTAADKSIRRQSEKVKKFHSDRSPLRKSRLKVGELAKKSSYPRDSLTSEDSYGKQTIASDRSHDRCDRTTRKIISNESTNDHKHLSHSYESIKDFIKDTNARPTKSIFNVSESLVSSTPQKKNDRIVIGDSSMIVRPNESSLAVNSPRNNKSVLKSTTGGSVSSLTKKKVLFDLESPQRRISTNNEERSMYPSNNEQDENPDKKNTSESDFEISSIHDENIQADERKEDSPQSGKVVLLKTSQSEKIAQISQQIEKQLSIARRKPAGAVEAMFLEKFKLGSDKRETPMNVYPNFMSPSRSLENTIETKRQRTTEQNRDSRFLNTHNHSNEIKDTNLEMDIDELLQME